RSGTGTQTDGGGGEFNHLSLERDCLGAGPYRYAGGSGAARQQQLLPDRRRKSGRQGPLPQFTRERNQILKWTTPEGDVGKMGRTRKESGPFVFVDEWAQGRKKGHGDAVALL